MATDGQHKQRLSERLKQTQANELAEVEKSTRLELTRLGERLRQLVSAELSTTESAISEQKQAINLLLQQQRRALNTHSQTLEKMKSLTESEAQGIKRGLTAALQQAQSETLEQALSPLKASLKQLQKEGEALHSITIKAWLKPLLISLAVTVGVGLGAFGITQTMGLIYSQKINQISQLNQEIKQAQQTLDELPKGITFVSQKGKKYILSPKIGRTFKLGEGQYKGKMAVEIE